MTNRQGQGQAQGHTVLTVNLCCLAAGATNRHLPYFIQYATMAFSFAVGAAIAVYWNISGWICVASCLASPLICLCTALFLGIPLARLGVFLFPIFGVGDYKCERIELFLRALQDDPELASIDVICVQECYSALLFPGGYPEKLVEGARALGFIHAARPSRCPSFPALLGFTSGLAILSKRPMRTSRSKDFGLSFESFGVNRGALYAGLEDGTHIFTCHIAPTVSVAGDGVLSKMFGSLVEASRRRQIVELAQFMQENAPPDEPAIVAGDFNLSIKFDALDGKPLWCSSAGWVVAFLKNMCGVSEATHQIRSTALGISDATPMQFCKATCGHLDPPEWRLTSYCNGELKQSWDDAVFYRGFIGVDVAEVPFLIPIADRPHAAITHVSDHWGVRVQLKPL